MGRTKITFGLMIAAFAAAGLWSSLHQFAQIRASLHGHDTFAAWLDPHHVFVVLGPLTPLVLLVTAAVRARRLRNAWLPRIDARELVGSCMLLEGAELASGSMAHSWLMATVLILAAMAVSLLLAMLAVKVVRLVANRIRRGRPRAVTDAVQVWMRGRVDVTHPSRAWLARRSRRGPPAMLPVAT